MKSLIFISLVFFCSITANAQSVAINTDGSLPNSSSLLDVKSINKGLLIPRMTTAQRTVIVTPATGLMVFDTDTNGFWFYSGAGWVQLAAGGATNYWSLNGANIFNNNAGNVGIGTNIATDKLTVNSIGNGITHTNGTVSLTTYLGSDGSGSPNGGWLGTVSNHPLYFYTNGGIPKMSILQNGYVGIGTAIPLSMLHINGGIKINGTNPIELGAGITKEANAGKIGYQIFTPDALDIVGAGTTGLNRKIKFWNEGGAFFSGKVGIGLTNPRCMLTILSGTINTSNNTEVLQLAGRNPMQLFSDENGTDFAYLKGVTDNSVTPQYPYAGLEIGAAPNTVIYLSANYGPVLTIASNNNVGIGTTNPTYKLSVNGNIRSKEVVVETGWADYVFNEKYKLAPLENVEKFSLQNKHLPNIPSAKEVEEKGLFLGDTQKRMMEKIEELTLYLIEANRQLKKSVNEIDELKVKVAALETFKVQQ